MASEEWGYGHKTVCHARDEDARDEDGGGRPVAAALLAAPAPGRIAGGAAAPSRLLPGGPQRASSG